MSIDKKKILILFRSIDYKYVLLLYFLAFSLFYFSNFDKWNDKVSVDFLWRYRPNGLKLINELLNLNFNSTFFTLGLPEGNFLNFYFLSELFTGILLKITPNWLYFSLITNFVSIFAVFFSFYFHLKILEIKNKNLITFISLFIFFIYIGNWDWIFWKLVDYHFLFIFTLIFYFVIQAINQNKLIYFLYGLIFSLAAVFIKPNGVIAIPFFILGVFLLKYYKKSFFKIIFIFFTVYFLSLPLLIFISIKFNYANIFANFFLAGNITGNIFYKYEDFINQFNFVKNDFTLLLYFYFLALKKLLYQLAFLRDTYSLRHNIFIFFYTLIIYFFLIINLDYLIKKYNLFFKLLVLLILLLTMLYCSTLSADESNRYQLPYLVPLYILISISVSKFFNNFLKNLK
jgi:hypothetical protein